MTTTSPTPRPHEHEQHPPRDTHQSEPCDWAEALSESSRNYTRLVFFCLGILAGALFCLGYLAGQNSEIGAHRPANPYPFAASISATPGELTAGAPAPAVATTLNTAVLNTAPGLLDRHTPRAHPAAAARVTVPAGLGAATRDVAAQRSGACKTVAWVDPTSGRHHSDRDDRFGGSDMITAGPVQSRSARTSRPARAATIKAAIATRPTTVVTAATTATVRPVACPPPGPGYRSDPGGYYPYSGTYYPGGYGYHGGYGYPGSYPGYGYPGYGYPGYGYPGYGYPGYGYPGYGYPGYGYPSYGSRGR